MHNSVCTKTTKIHLWVCSKTSLKTAQKGDQKGSFFKILCFLLDSIIILELNFSRFIQGLNDTFKYAKVQINWEKSEKIDFMKSLKDSNHLIYYGLQFFN